MRNGGQRPFRFALPLAIVLPVLALAAVAYVAFANEGDAGPPPLALGSQGGSFHPVAGNFRPDDTVLEDCAESYTCLHQAFGNVAYKQGPKRALAIFEQQISADEMVRKDCHRIAHSIGSAAFARYDENVAKTFSLGSATCASGYYHGILERAFIGINTKDKLVRIARKLCIAEGIRRYSFLDYQCRHGLGHGLMIQTGYDLPLSLSTCTRLDTRWDDLVCAGGVFMENVNTAFGYRSPWLKEEDPLYPCNEVASRHQRGCYLRASLPILAFHKHDWAAASRTCAEFAPELARSCLRGMGRDAVAQANYAPGKILSLCGLVVAPGECLMGAARTIGDGFAVAGTRRAAALCRTAAAQWRESCFGGVGVIVGLLYPTDNARQRACAKLAGRLADVCSRAAVGEVDPRARGTWN